MTSPQFDFEKVVRQGLPAPAGRWNGFPKFNFVGGHNAPENIPTADLIAAVTRVLEREGSTLATYNLESGPQGYRPLREFVAEKLGRDAGMTCSADDVLMTSGSLQGLDLINAVLLAPGDTVLIEAATYGGTLTRFQRLGVTAVGIGLDEHGMRMDELASALKTLTAEGRKPKFIYTIPTVQNPTASIMPLERRQELLRLAAEYDVPVVEDECYSDLIWSGERPPAMHALDDSGRVIFVGSFSKSIAPALRVGFVVAPWAFMARMLPLKTDAGSGALEQMVLAEYCREHFVKHVGALNKTLKAKCDALVEAVEASFGTAAEFERPPGGIFLWVKLPAEVDTSLLAREAAKHGIEINPGAEWSIEGPDAKRALRICYANPPIETIRKGVAALAEVCREQFGVPKTVANR
ncbi:MAG: PLP-dependent aminotransferase family protein [Nisaea sp.]|uniref:aminotransferase-like domain-containing protein n=1 Tax=Nisaea sp. TaxID=2024842 RepID=UPI001B134A43|nr:PLP-dependent aminotransferase family protein [Nisaea sp.]MBO6560726.1 PLP-dependent aminotransferase family protein [Nisaea sp.]